MFPFLGQIVPLFRPEASESGSRTSYTTDTDWVEKLEHKTKQQKPLEKKRKTTSATQQHSLPAKLATLTPTWPRIVVWRLVQIPLEKKRCFRCPLRTLHVFFLLLSSWTKTDCSLRRWRFNGWMSCRSSRNKHSIRFLHGLSGGPDLKTQRVVCWFNGLLSTWPVPITGEMAIGRWWILCHHVYSWWPLKITSRSLQKKELFLQELLTLIRNHNGRLYPDELEDFFDRVEACIIYKTVDVTSRSWIRAHLNSIRIVSWRSILDYLWR